MAAKFSLIIATLGRREPVAKLLRSLAEQACPNWEAIIVDQNPEGYLDGLIASCGIPIILVRSTPGLSKARNLGLAEATGDLIAFPDDDCWYAPSVLESVADWSESFPDVGVFALELAQNHTSRNNTQARRPSFADKRAIWKHCMSTVLFFRRQVLELTGGFDESLGLGAGTPWGSGEETELILRAKSAGVSVLRVPTQVHHPPTVPSFSAPHRRKIFKYSLGTGRVMRITGSSAGEVASMLARPILRAFYYATTFRIPPALYFGAMALGRTIGFTAARPRDPHRGRSC